ncbi:type II toxin-antitoxin system HipA family toxin [Agrobacterium rubi]|uniref:Type II toxin-antitoxin system HipA family toxin n=1 Tax=Agrobacterium rubi TaxID=28099 RepID=A0AAE7R5S0_9HYPH|nr:type II toxin-antitoxin system HipA family toxin [Agrobacterium rubi]NTE90119.1 type II toxin-antitoxin system HipA family toxin [Agrobacterium rubi]NTF05965.1 type II toxin-antitoxin system HipA family toxin [Agrobacterium rubi]NTF09181.1 type II toxin-antitoxin system HipA family toxin [Agrobacterium rubi]NTF23137.1 type II toxin-antitoxin system HipA family toxin [Agrobacterium rubi]NTF30425.1 type II toxin-antitoxin system HipA family toxin [Agrobacterium rubi]
MPDVSVLSVRLYGEEIGTITYVGAEKTLFTFNDAYVENPERPTLGLQFKNEFGELITDFRPYKIKLMPYFSNLLPEGHLRRYLAEKADIHTDREFFLLWVLGQDLPGGITVVPAHGEEWPDEAHNILKGEAAKEAAEDAMRFSLAGVQLKFSAVQSASGGLTIPTSGVGGNRIVKLPSREFANVPENEFSMMSLARMVGINVPAIGLIDVRSIGNLPDGIEKIGQQAFVIERFDRNDDGSVTHIEDFAQIFNVYPENKYKKASYRNLISVIASESDHDDVAEFIRRLTFNVLIGNGDMHLKNWSLIYPDRRNARLAPAYDFVSTIAYIANDKSALTFSRTKEFTGFTLDELAHLSAKANLPRKLVLDTAKETVALFMERWETETANLPMRQDVVETIDKHLTTLPIVTGNE